MKLTTELKVYIGEKINEYNNRKVKKTAKQEQLEKQRNEIRKEIENLSQKLAKLKTKQKQTYTFEKRKQNGFHVDTWSNIITHYDKANYYEIIAKLQYQDNETAKEIMKKIEAKQFNKI